MANVSMSRRRLAAALMALVVPGVALGNVSDQTASDAPTRLLDGAQRLTVQVFLNGRGPYAFLVDTGANASVISSALVAELGLPAGRDVNLHGIAGVQMVSTVTLDSVRVGHREQRGLALSVLPERHLRAPGILGLDWLGEQGLTLDVAGRRMRIGASLPRTDEYSISVPARLQRSGLTLIDASVSGVSTLAFLDTGSSTTVGNRALMEEARRRRAVSDDWTDMQLVSVTGQTLQGRVAALKRLTLGKVILQNVPVVFGPVHTFDYWGISDKPAILLGMDVLNVFKTVSLDYRRGAVHFQLKPTSSG